MQLSLLEESLVKYFADNPQEALKLPENDQVELAALTLAFFQNNTDATIGQVVGFVDGLIAEQISVMNSIDPKAAENAGIPETSEERIRVLSHLVSMIGESDKTFFMHVGDMLVTHAKYIEALQLAKNAG
jgi:hypothetical protein